MHELQQILLQKLPRLGKLTFWCEVKYRDYNNRLQVIENTRDGVWIREADKDNCFEKIEKITDYEIIGHKPSHADILEALGEDWAMHWNWRLIRANEDWEHYDWAYWDWDKRINYPKLPLNISDLSLPEYEETCERLISLLTK